MRYREKHNARCLNRPHTHLWSSVFGNDRKNAITKKSFGKGFLRIIIIREATMFDKVRNTAIRKPLNNESLLSVPNDLGIDDLAM